MERLTIDTGGRPIKSEDIIEYLQAFEIFETWFDDLLFDECIVSGCEVTGGVGNYDVAAGIIFYNGKLRIFDAVVGVAFPLLLTPAFININAREYEEGVVKYTGQIYKMVPDVGGAFSFDLDTPRTLERIEEVTLNSGFNPVAITSASMTMGVIAYSSIGRTTFLASIQAEFDFTSGGVIEPIIVFDQELPEAIVGSVVVIWDSEFGLGVAEITAVTPDLTFKLKQTYGSGNKTIKFLGTISLA